MNSAKKSYDWREFWKWVLEQGRDYAPLLVVISLVVGLIYVFWPINRPHIWRSLVSGLAVVVIIVVIIYVLYFLVTVLRKLSRRQNRK